MTRLQALREATEAAEDRMRATATVPCWVQPDTDAIRAAQARWDAARMELDTALAGAQAEQEAEAG